MHNKKSSPAAREILTRCAGNPHPLRGKSSPAAREILIRCAGNPKSEIRNPKEISNQNAQIQNPLSCFGF